MLERRYTTSEILSNWLIQIGCRDRFSKALFFVGEFGVNDYSFLWSAGKTEEEVRSYVPKVVQKIAMAVEVYICCANEYLFL
jgi:hypothetical protein